METSNRARAVDLLTANRDALLARSVRVGKGSVDYLQWRLARRVGPPPSIYKRWVIRRYGLRYGAHVFIETGTYLGDTLRTLANDFDVLYSIELGQDMFKAAEARFKSERHVFILHGDSATQLPRLLLTVDQPAVIWLDAHWSGGKTARGSVDSPVQMELSACLDSGWGHVVLVDDAREFDGSGGYPTIGDLEALVRSLRPDYKFEVKDDIVRMTPRSD